MVANTKQSYDVTIECMIMGTTTKSTNSLDLKNPYFRYTGVQPPPPPGQDSQSPSEAYWSQVDMQGARQVGIDAGGLFLVCQELKRNLFAFQRPPHNSSFSQLTHLHSRSTVTFLRGGSSSLHLSKSFVTLLNKVPI